MTGERTESIIADVVRHCEDCFHLVESKDDLQKLLRECFAKSKEAFCQLPAEDRIAVVRRWVELSSSRVLASTTTQEGLMIVCEEQSDSALGRAVVVWVLYARTAPTPEAVTAFVARHCGEVVAWCGLGVGEASESGPRPEGTWSNREIGPERFMQLPMALAYDRFSHEYFESLLAIPRAREGIAQVLRDYCYDSTELLETARKFKEGSR